MTPTDVPSILVVDDHADDERAKLHQWTQVADVSVRHPQDVEQVDLERADLVVVDYRLDEWPERDQLEAIGLKPRNGLALISVFRSHLKSDDGPPTAFLLRSAHLSDLSGDFPPETRLHTIARQNNLDWVQQKTAADNANQIIVLANALKALPPTWPKNDSDACRKIVETLLQVPQNVGWRDSAWRRIEECHPPLHELQTRRHGLRFIRWLLHRILPYPCFLWTEEMLSARLRVTADSLRAAISTGLSDVFRLAQYSGILSGFNGLRWWGSGCESVLWTVTEGNSFDISHTIDSLNQRCGGCLVPLNIRQPVTPLNSNFQPLPVPCVAALAVRIQPDDWPPFADDAWARIEDVLKEPKLRAIVVSEQRDRIDRGAGEQGS